jgi:hypothetical protein
LDDDTIEADRGDDVDPWEEEEEEVDGEGIAIRTATLIVGGGELELSSVIEMFAEIERELGPLLSADDDETGAVEEELGFKNILARVSKEGGVVILLVEAVRRFSSSSPPLGVEWFIGVGIGMGTGGWTPVRLCAEPEQTTEDRGSV